MRPLYRTFHVAIREPSPERHQSKFSSVLKIVQKSSKYLNTRLLAEDAIDFIGIRVPDDFVGSVEDEGVFVDHDLSTGHKLINYLFGRHRFSRILNFDV
jgi:hypothetical protein